jgi:hypothetical protein
MLNEANITRRVPHVQQEMLTQPVYLGSIFVVSGIHVARSLFFCAMFRRLFFFRLVIVLSLFRFTTIDYPFGIVKHFLQTTQYCFVEAFDICKIRQNYTVKL